MVSSATDAIAMSNVFEIFIVFPFLH